MRLRTLLGIGVAACVMILATTQVLSQEKETRKAGPPEQIQLDPEAEAWCKAATPGPNHELLNYCVGKWNATCKQWLEPGAPASESKATCENKWVLGRRYVETHYEGQFMEMPFTGIGYTGYDNVQKKFVSVWIDNMGTGLMTEQGRYDPTTKEFAYRGEFPSPMGGTIKSKTIVRVISNDQHVMIMYHMPPGAKELNKFMEITYTRAGGDKKATFE